MRKDDDWEYRTGIFARASFKMADAGGPLLQGAAPAAAPFSVLPIPASGIAPTSTPTPAANSAPVPVATQAAGSFTGPAPTQAPVAVAAPVAAH
jgi:hypothetical protein